MMQAKKTHVDLFCGAGGTTQGAKEAGLDTVLAVNHWRTAVFSHQDNHPDVRHICARIDDIDPRNDKSIPEFDILTASPECTHHSIARGGKPIDDQKRATPWHVLVWTEAKRPRGVIVENVREFRDWGPLDDSCRPIKSRKGETFRAWVKSLESLGYVVDHQLLNAADYGAATSRTRLFIQAIREDVRRKNALHDLPWPEITHSKPQWRPAWSIIDWSIPCPSIFTRKRPLAEKTLRRIEVGLRKFCGNRTADAFIVRFNNNCDASAVSEPLSTITTSGAHHGLCLPFMVNYHGGTDPDRDGTERAASIDRPLPVIDTENRYGLVAPFIMQNSHTGSTGRSSYTFNPSGPMPTLTGSSENAVAMPFFLPRQGYFDCHRDKPAASIDDPLNTITANHGPGHLVVPFLADTNHAGDDDRTYSGDEPLRTISTHNGKALCLPFLTKYYGTGGCQPVNEPIDTITAKDRFGLAMVSLVETMKELGIVDIGFRMLEPSELSRAQGFPASYHYHGTRAEQVRQIGNAVCPPVARALFETLAEAI